MSQTKADINYNEISMKISIQYKISSSDAFDFRMTCLYNIQEELGFVSAQPKGYFEH